MERGGDACVALAEGEMRTREQGVPSPHIIHPRPDGKTWFHPPELDAYGVIPLVALLDIGQ